VFIFLLLTFDLFYLGNVLGGLGFLCLESSFAAEEEGIVALREVFSCFLEQRLFCHSFYRTRIGNID